MTYLLLCVTQLGSPADASKNQAQVLSLTEHPPTAVGAPVTFPVAGIRNANGDYVAGNHGIVQIDFTKGSYYVFVVGTGLSPTGGAAAQSLATTLAKAQYLRLPS
jgi:hypothetical protein